MNVVTMVELSTNELTFLTDLMMGCPLGYTKDNALSNSVDDTKLFEHLLKCRDTALKEVQPQ